MSAPEHDPLCAAERRNRVDAIFCACDLIDRVRADTLDKAIAVVRAKYEHGTDGSGDYLEAKVIPAIEELRGESNG